MIILTSTISVNIWQIITYELPKYLRFESLTVNVKVQVMRYNVADDVQIECPTT